MKGTIRIVVGLLLVFGGVGGMEANETVTLPLDSLAVAIAGLFIMAWGTFAANREMENRNV